MSDLLNFKTATELAISAAVLAGFNTYLPDLFQFVCVLVGLSWVKYIFLDREKPKKPVLNPTEWQKFPLKEKIIISHNVALYRFALPSPDHVLGLPIGQHISVQAEIAGKLVQRSYTPTSSDDDHGSFDLLIKSYPTGNISKYIGMLEVGNEISVRGPKGQFKYTPGMVRAFGMIAGGTGITPMLQIIKAILKNPDDETKISLIFANVNYEDILLKADLDDLASHNENFNVYYVLNNPPEGWTGGIGYTTEEMVKENCPPPAKDIKILLCGPPPMISAMSNYCEKLGYDKGRSISKLEDQVFKF